MTNRLNGKSAIVTGGSSGMGRHMALDFARQGANVLICGRKMDRLAPVVEEAKDLAGTLRAFECDIRDPKQVKALVQYAMDQFGAIDILVNNAAGNFVCKAEDLSINGWNAVIQTVLNGTWYCTQEAGKAMIAAGKGGAILNMVASYARTGSPGVVHSAAAKAGVVAMTRTLAAEWGRYGIRVNGLAPGPIEGTGGAEKLWPNEEIRQNVIREVPLGRLGRLEEVCAAASFLVSDEAAYMTGDVLILDGGSWLNKGFLSLWESERQEKR
jgi:NAD(P)-dependent dehydrogenase (short-subunit alcohol dehydrogenase family)